MASIQIKKRIFLIFLVCEAGSFLMPGFGQNFVTSEYEIKAAYLYNFSKFIEWPGSSMKQTQGTFIIGVLGKDPFGGFLEQVIEGKNVRGAIMTIKRFHRLDELQYCNILFISASETSNLSKIFDSLKNENILTVSDMPEFIRNGGMIQLYAENNKIRFAIHVGATERSNLKLSAKLLNLAKIPMD